MDAINWGNISSAWQADVIEGFANNNIAFTTPWGFELKMDAADQQFYFRNSSGITKFFNKRSGYARIEDGVGNAGTGTTQSHLMTNGWVRYGQMEH